jgi:hypothetical protein
MPAPLRTAAAFFVIAACLVSRGAKAGEEADTKTASAVAKDPDAPQPNPPGPRRWAIEGGVALQSLFGIRITAGSFGLTWTAPPDVRSASPSLAFEGAVGSTEDGVRTLTLQAGLNLDWHLGRAGLGGGFRLGTFTYARPEGGSSNSMSLGGFLRGTVDVVDDGVVFVFLRLGVDVMGSSESVLAYLYGGSVGLGVRF